MAEETKRIMVRLPLDAVLWLEREATAQHRTVAGLLRHYTMQRYEEARRHQDEKGG